MSVDKGTFGGKGASVVLAKILAERKDPKITKKVGRIICQYDLYLNDLKLIRNLNSHNGLLHEIHKKFIERTYSLFDSEIGNFVRNVLSGKYKAYLNDSYSLSKLYTRTQVIDILTEKHVSDFYPNPDPEGSDHEKNRYEIKKWLDIKEGRN